MISASKWFLWLCGLFWEPHPAVGQIHTEQGGKDVSWGFTLHIFLLFISSHCHANTWRCCHKNTSDSKSLAANLILSFNWECTGSRGPCYHLWKCSGQVEPFLFRWCTWRVCAGAWDLSPLTDCMCGLPSWISAYISNLVLVCNTPLNELILSVVEEGDLIHAQ